MKAYDFAIVGQGIAGTLLAYFLKKAGKKVVIYDNNYEGSSSKVAAGIVNPVTGRKFVRSWRINEFLPFARNVYEEIGRHLQITAYTPANIIRSLESIEDENNWLARTADPDVSEYMLATADISSFAGKVNTPFGYGELAGTFHVHLHTILESFRNKWMSDNCYFTDKFMYNELIINSDSFGYGDLTFSELVFCEGFQVINNPFFRDLPIAPTKGEALIVRIPDAGFRKMYKDKVFIVHQYDDVYWVGAGYERDSKDDLPTPKAYTMLKSELQRILKIPFEILDHKAAIRPTMHTRRPVIMQHHDIGHMYIFNGFGTKAASITPFAASQFSNYLLFKNPGDLSLL
jgi:glycine/D-amino acid oxidase-like deaminating enzyme